MTEPPRADRAVEVPAADQLTTLFAAHYPSPLPLASALVDSPAEAEGVVHEAFVPVDGVLRRRGGEVGMACVRQAAVNSRAPISCLHVAWSRRPAPLDGD